MGIYSRMTHEQQERGIAVLLQLISYVPVRLQEEFRETFWQEFVRERQTVPNLALSMYSATPASFDERTWLTKRVLREEAEEAPKQKAVPLGDEIGMGAPVRVTQGPTVTFRSPSRLADAQRQDEMRRKLAALGYTAKR
jgi:hypothetical protein